ncbi:MAG: amidohydrolase, partial [Bacteroidota bacterium]
MRLLFCFLLSALCLTATAQPDLPPPDARGDLLIRGATVLTVINGTLENTDVLVRDGKIAE